MGTAMRCRNCVALGGLGTFILVAYTCLTLELAGQPEPNRPANKGIGLLRAGRDKVAAHKVAAAPFEAAGGLGAPTRAPSKEHWDRWGGGKHHPAAIESNCAGIDGGAAGCRRYKAAMAKAKRCFSP